jgi:glucose-1-phosphate thymidylyltransferase
MGDIIGILPGAGRASRIGGFFKELTPIKVNDEDISKFIVVCEQIIMNLKRGGASPIYFVINSEKNIISDYFNKLSLFSTVSLYFSLQGQTDLYYGMPFAIDKIYNEAKGKTVMMGMPDTLIEPEDSFETLYGNFREHNADLELGLYSIEPDNQGGYIDFDGPSKRVLSHIDKTHKDFPADVADNAWAIACWNDKFTEFIHEFILKNHEKYRHTGFGETKELLFGDIIDAAIESRRVNIYADFIDKEKGYYLDISEPRKYFKAVLHYHTPSLINGERINATKGGNRQKKKLKVFISHSSKQRELADDLHYMLSKLTFEPYLDKYDIKPGEQLSKKIESLISDCDLFVLLISKDTFHSAWVQTEVALAYSKGMIDRGTLIPVQLEQLSAEEANMSPLIPKNTYNWLDSSNGLKNVIEYIDSLVETENF